MGRRSTYVLIALATLSLLLASLAPVAAGQDQLGTEGPDETGTTDSLLGESDLDAIRTRLEQDATRARPNRDEIGGDLSSAAQCYSRRTNDTADDDPNDDLNIIDATIKFDCSTLEMTVQFGFDGGLFAESQFEFSEIALTANDPPDNSLGCGGDEFEVLVWRDSEGFFGSVYFVPFPTCDIDNFVWLDTVDITTIPTNGFFAFLLVDVWMPVVGLPTPIHWWASIMDTDDIFPSPGTDHINDSGHRIKEAIPTGGFTTAVRWFVSNTLKSGDAEFTFDFGEVYDYDLLIGDWDGDGKTGVGSRRGRTFTLLDDISPNGTAAASTTTVVNYGKPWDQVYVGDWDGDGDETLAVRRGNIFHVKNSIGGGDADAVIGYGKAADEVFVGDWDGDGEDTFAVRRGNVFFVRNSVTTGVADEVFGYGKATDRVLVGDWDGDGIDTFAVRRGNIIFIRNDFKTAPAEFSFGYGRATDGLGAGDWDGDGMDTFIIVRGLIE